MKASADSAAGRRTDDAPAAKPAKTDGAAGASADTRPAAKAAPAKAAATRTAPARATAAKATSVKAPAAKVAVEPDADLATPMAEAVAVEAAPPAIESPRDASEGFAAHAAARPGFSAQPQAAAPMPPMPMPPPIPAAAANDRRPPDRMHQPRAHAKAETFVEGDHVVYPTHGVGKVERIAVEEIAGHKLELIHITFEENRMTLRVPVTKAPAAGLRKLATRKMFDEALAVLKGRARIKRTMWSRRAQEYEAKINSGDPLAIAEVVRDLHRNAGQPDQSFSERQIYEAAMDRLAAELAALDKTDKATAVEKLANFLKTIA